MSVNTYMYACVVYLKKLAYLPCVSRTAAVTSKATHTANDEAIYDDHQWSAVQRCSNKTTHMLLQMPSFPDINIVH